MKLTIDIPEDLYEQLVKNKEFYTTTTIFSAITNGTPYEERPKGEWKLHGMIYYCSNCGKDYEQGGNNFCGQCGADMRGANNG